MAQQVIDVGTSASDGTGDPLREAFTKINDNFTEVYGTVENGGLTYGNISSNIASITFNVTRYAESYSAIPVLKGTGQSIGNVYVIRGNVLGGTTPINDVYLTVTALANATVGNVATVSAAGFPTAPVLRVNGLTGNVTLTVNNIDGAASRAYVNAAIAANVANVVGSVTDSLSANITAANAVISNHTARINTLESNAATQATAIANLNSTKATISYVDTSIGLALSSNAILANVASTNANVALVNANVAAANAAIALRANLSNVQNTFVGNINANNVHANNTVRADSYFIGGTEINQGLGQTWANPAALFFSNTFGAINRHYQINVQNLDAGGTGDLVITADDGTDASNFISLGLGGSQTNDPFFPSIKPHTGYIYVEGGNLLLQSHAHSIDFITGNLVTPQISFTTGNVLQFRSNVVIQFADGTVQSTAFGGNANLTAVTSAISNLQANAAAQSLELDLLNANAGTQAATINSLSANAATQATAINLVNANIVAANTNITSLTVSTLATNANLTAANLNIVSLTSNAATQALELDNLQSNAQAQQASIIILQSNAATQAVQIDLLNSNLTAANTNISSLTANAATQAVQVNLLNANLTAANLNITNLQSNAASQALDINNLYTNVNVYLANVVSSNANIAAANARIIVLDANLGSTTTNVSTLQSNAVTQASQINLLNANVTAANIVLLTKANVINGNIQANYFIANANVKIASTLEVGNTNPINYPGLGGVFVGNVNGYYQVVVQNTNSGSSASGDFVITADDGSDSNNYITMGINSSGWTGNFQVPAGDTGLPEFAHDGYVSSVGGNISISSDNNVFFVANTSSIILSKDGDLQLGTKANLRFSDNTVLSSANIGAQPYSPNNIANYNGTITNIQQALDQLAARLQALGG